MISTVMVYACACWKEATGASISYMHIYMYAYTYIHAYMNAHTHAHTHTHMHTHYAQRREGAGVGPAAAGAFV